MTETASALLVGIVGLVVAFLSVAYLATLRE
jgi:hypothetical protein